MSYVDGFVLAVPKDNLEAYKKMAQEAGEVWKEYGAHDYVECVADDVPYGEVTSFPRAVQPRTMRSWSFHGSPMNRASTAMPS